ncbi:LADA_0F02146g1_1 [Lachancea dasiensis]|uniref:LADA_0F02146g1_1 n=1 Tax=Lachancea dasiensis TaxID=1072105 RepID=A0A1G4JIA1_9SACH|nr:LADA_0F02146g1_1 [Lachancea dasiensis]
MAADNSDEPQRSNPEPPARPPSLLSNLNPSATRNIRVTIQYAVLDHRRLNPDGNEPNESLSRVPFVLNFTDVPSSATQERLEQVVALASNVAIGRLHRRYSRPKGITKEAFEKLPVVKLAEVGQSSCSICYEDFVEEIEDSKIDGKEGRKRNQESEGDADRESSEAKRARLTNAFDTNEPPSELPAQSAAEPSSDYKNSTSESYKHSPVQLQCNHIFGRECIREWTKEHNSCPICRASIVQADGLSDSVNSAEEDEENLLDQQTFERIRTILYGPTPNGMSQQTTSNTNFNASTDTGTNTNATTTTTTNTTSNTTINTDANAISNEDSPAPSGAWPETMGPSANIFILRSSQLPAASSSGQTANSNVSQSASNTLHIPATPVTSPPLVLDVMRPGGIGTLPISFVAIRRRDSNQQQDTEGSNDSANAPSETTTHLPDGDRSTTSTTFGPNSTARSASGADRPMDSSRIMTLVDHILGLPNRQQLNPSMPTALSGDLPEQLGTAAVSDATVSGGGEEGAQMESAATRRGFIFNSILGFARNLGNLNENWRSSPNGQTSNELFNTGVASQRTDDGVSTMTFNGEMPSPPSQRSSSQGRNDEAASNSNTQQGSGQPDTSL